LKRMQGISLIELIVSLVLLILVIVSVGTIIPYTQLGMRDSNYKNIATTQGEGMIEAIRALDWNDIDKSGTSYNGTKAVPDGQYKGRYPPSPYPCKRIHLDAISPGADATIELEKAYSLVVRTFYDPPLSDSVIRVMVSVYWDMPGNDEAQAKRVTISSKICRGK
jgi:hypothetical protein